MQQETKRLLRRMDRAGLTGDLELEWRISADLSRADRFGRRDTVEDAITDRCGNQAVLPYWSDIRHDDIRRVIILHSTSDGARDFYGSGAKGGLVRRALRPIMPDRVSELGVVWFRVDGSPTVSQVLAHRGITDRALDAAGGHFVLLHGAHALHAWRPDLTLKQYAGRVGLWQRRWWVLPVPQVDGVTSRRSEYSMEDWQRMVGRFVELAESHDPFQFIGQTCTWRARDTTCGVGAVHWDYDAVPYCERHWEEAQALKEKVARKKDRETRALEKETIFDV